MAEGEGFWGHVIEHLFVYLAGIVLCVLGALGWAYFPRQAAFVANHIDPSSAAAKEDINPEERAKKNLKKCIIYHWHELLAKPAQHLARGKAELLFQAEEILSGKSCRSELDELTPGSIWVPPKLKAVDHQASEGLRSSPLLEKIQTNRELWKKEEWSQIAAAGPILGTPPAPESRSGSPTSVLYGPLTASPLSLAELKGWVKVQAVRDAVATWAEAFRSRNAASMAECYAPVVERYFHRTNVTRDQIRRDKQSVLASTLDIRKFEVNDINIEVDTTQSLADSNDRTAATLRKEWDIAKFGGRESSGEAIEELTFISSPEGWKIIREEELGYSN